MDRDGTHDLDDENVVVKDGETPLKGTFIDMFGSSESFAIKVALRDVGTTAGFLPNFLLITTVILLGI